MTRCKTLSGGLLLCLAVSAHGQIQSSSTPPAPAAGKSKPKRKTQEQILLEQLNEKFGQLEQLTEKYNKLQDEVEDIKKQLAERDAELDKAHAAAQAKVIPQPQPVPSVPAEVPVAVQAKIDELNAKSAELAKAVELNRSETKALENPTTIRFRGIELTPGGFVAGETVDRQRAIGGDIDTQFSGIPFRGQTAGVLSEFNASGRQSRISLLAEGKISSATLRAFYETDFLSAGTTSNDNQSNSYTLRLRQAWAQAALSDGWTLTGGQMWSLATEYRDGLSNNAEAIPMTIDAQYNVGFTWARQYGFRAVKHIGSNFWLGAAAEEAQTLNIGGHNLPTIAYQQAGNAGGLYNPTANYSYNYAPDLIAKAAYQTSFGHFEVLA